mmetsp:Transcript_13095/g.26684  ORF Transcript_13095/g.26684 Transcript_13095/m.26684 type:complete len:217 (-) Transcript_13095:151-801(-)
MEANRSRAFSSLDLTPSTISTTELKGSSPWGTTKGISCLLGLSSGMSAPGCSCIPSSTRSRSSSAKGCPNSSADPRLSLLGTTELVSESTMASSSSKLDAMKVDVGTVAIGLFSPGSDIILFSGCSSGVTPCSRSVTDSEDSALTSSSHVAFTVPTVFMCWICSCCTICTLMRAFSTSKLSTLTMVLSGNSIDSNPQVKQHRYIGAPVNSTAFPQP